MKFHRRNTTAYLRLGKKRKKLRKWRKPMGRHSKTREKRKGYPKKVEIGYKNNKKTRKFLPVLNNLKELENFKEKEAILGNIGNKKKQIMIEKAKQLNIVFVNWRKK